MAAAAATEVPLLNMTTKPGTVYQFRKVSTILVKSIINCLLFLGKDSMICQSRIELTVNVNALSLLSQHHSRSSEQSDFFPREEK